MFRSSVVICLLACVMYITADNQLKENRIKELRNAISTAENEIFEALWQSKKYLDSKLDTYKKQNFTWEIKRSHSKNLLTSIFLRSHYLDLNVSNCWQNVSFKNLFSKLEELKANPSACTVSPIILFHEILNSEYRNTVKELNKVEEAVYRCFSNTTPSHENEQNETANEEMKIIEWCFNSGLSELKNGIEDYKEFVQHESHIVHVKLQTNLGNCKAAKHEKHELMEVEDVVAKVAICTKQEQMKQKESRILATKNDAEARMKAYVLNFL